MKKNIIVIAIIVVVAAGFWFLTRPSGTDSGSGDASNTTNHTAGSGTTGVELVEYGDFQCPACGRFYPVLVEIKKKYADTDKIKFTFRNFPLDSIHPNARAAHRAAEAASNQGKFWEMYDKLYETQQVWSNESNPYDSFRTYAEQLGLDLTKFDTDYKSEAVNRAINNDVKAGQAIKVTSTPTFVLDGKIIESETLQNVRFSQGLQTAVDDFSKIIDEAIAAKNPDTATPTPASEDAQSASPTPSPEATATPAAEQ